MNRSRRHVFVPFCLLAQGVRATGIVKHYAAVVTPVLELLMKEKVNIIQMACPELIFDGFHRRPCGKSNYDNPENRKICHEVAEREVRLMEMFSKSGHTVEAIIGVDFSPSCAVRRLTGNRPGRYQEGQGIYIEELRKIMNSRDIKSLFVGVQVYHINDTLRELSDILQKRN